MAKKELILILFVIAVLSTLVIITALTMTLFAKKPETKETGKSAPQITEIKEFFCKGLTGFSFRYPVFKGWEVKGIQKKENFAAAYGGPGCTIWLEHPEGLGLEVPPYIAVVKEDTSSKFIELPSDAKTNPNGVQYAFVYEPSWHVSGAVPEADERDYIAFYGSDFIVKVWAYSVVEEAGFYMDDFVKEVVKSFKLLEKVNMQTFSEIISELEKSEPLTMEELEKILGSAAIPEKPVTPNPYFDFYYGPIKIGKPADIFESFEFRAKKDSQDSLLILNIKNAVAIPQSDIIKLYPDAQPLVGEPADPNNGLFLNKQWGKLSFSINKISENVVSVQLDTIDTTAQTK